MKRIGILLLAAGESKRMGRPKQLLDFEGQTLLEFTRRQLLECQPAAFLIVLGANSTQIVAQCHLTTEECCLNKNWKEGMGSSIAFGTQQILQNDPDLTHILIALVDQPHLRAADYDNLVQKAFQHPAKIIAAFYDGHLGAPMVFSKRYFSVLAQLKGDEGARKIVRGQMENVVAVSMPVAAFDWDTPEDVERI